MRLGEEGLQSYFNYSIPYRLIYTSVESKLLYKTMNKKINMLIDKSIQKVRSFLKRTYTHWNSDGKYSTYWNKIKLENHRDKGTDI